MRVALVLAASVLVSACTAHCRPCCAPTPGHVCPSGELPPDIAAIHERALSTHNGSDVRWEDLSATDQQAIRAHMVKTSVCPGDPDGYLAYFHRCGCWYMHGHPDPDYTEGAYEDHYWCPNQHREIVFCVGMCPNGRSK